MTKMMTEQLAVELFEQTDPEAELQLGDWVRVKRLEPDAEETMESEDFFYLKDFEKKKGPIVAVDEKRKTTYHVEIGKTIGVFYARDLEKLL